MTPEEKRAKDREYYKKNAEKKRERQKEYAKRNEKEIASRSREHYAKNRERILEYHRKYRERNRAVLREKETLRRYGINRDEFLKMADLQDLKCKICGEETELVIDHKHDGTRNVRGLICKHCNVGLGMFKESAVILRSAIKYIGGDNGKCV